MTGRYSNFWQADQGLSMFLGLLCVLLFVVPPMTESGIVGARWVATLLSLVLLAGAVRASREGALSKLVIIVAPLAFVIHWVTLLVPSILVAALDDAMVFLTLCLFVIVILRQVFREGTITLHRVFGAAAVYLTLGLMWAFAFDLVHLMLPGAIRFAEAPASQSVMPRLVYFSVVMLTTVGYGDITPVHPLARTLVIGEALIGQLYLAILIGSLASMAVHYSRQRR